MSEYTIIDHMENLGLGFVEVEEPNSFVQHIERLNDEYLKTEDSIVNAVSLYIEQHPLLKDARRDRDLSDRRRYLIWILRRNTTLTIQNIGRMFRRHHSTVISACQRHDELIYIKSKDYLVNTAEIRVIFNDLIKD